jgi:hypothetical protein
MRSRPIFTIAFIAIPIVAISVYLGFKTEQPFLGNLLAELAGTGFGVLVAVFLVDRIIREDRRARWSKARNYILGGIAAHLSDSLVDVLIFMPLRNHRPMTGIISGRESPDPAFIPALNAMVAELRSIKQNPPKDKHLSDYVIEWYEHAKWDLDQIQSVLTPMVLQSDHEQKLIDALLEFDQARRALHSGIISHKLVVTDAAYPRLIDLALEAANLYDAIIEYWKPN